jgi:hypothetical protein
MFNYSCKIFITELLTRIPIHPHPPPIRSDAWNANENLHSNSSDNFSFLLFSSSLIIRGFCSMATVDLQVLGRISVDLLLLQGQALEHGL